MEEQGFRLLDIPSVPPTEAQRMVEAGAYLIDVRELSEFQQVRIPGASPLPMSELGTSYSTLPTDQPVILYCRTGGRSAQAVAALTHQIDFTNVFNMDGGIVEWYEEGLPISTAPVEVPGLSFTEMEADVAAKELDNGDLRWVVDVREESEFITGHIEGARNIPFHQLPLRYQELPKGEPVLVTCDRGEVSTLAARLLVDLDFSDVRTVRGGLEAWRYRGLELSF